MSHFYGTCLNGNGKASTRCGHKSSGLTTIAASWRGAVRVELFHQDDTDQDWAVVTLCPWKGSGINRELYRGPIDAQAGGLEEA